MAPPRAKKALPPIPNPPAELPSKPLPLAPVNAEVKMEEDYFDYSIIDKEGKEKEVKIEEDYFSNGFIREEDDEDEEECRKRMKSSHGPSSSTSLNNTHLRILRNLRDRFMREHRWKEASGVLSVLLEATPHGDVSSDDPIPEEDRRNFMLAIELHKRFLSGDRRYHMWIRQIYEIWMRKLSWSKKSATKKNMLQLELALFYFAEGNVEEAHLAIKFVVQDHDFANEPSVNLLHGMILYQLWYSGLPKEFKIKGFYIGMPLETDEKAFNYGYQETEISESSNDHYAVDTEDVKFSSRYASESSVGKGKVFMDRKSGVPRKKSGAVSPTQKFYMSHSTEITQQNAGSSNLDNNLLNSSIFFAHGLDTSLLPIQLQHLTGDLKQSICQYRRLANEHYRDAVKYLRLALHSTPPVLAALLPLIQLLLLGDRVEEAFKELENSCRNFDTALPFRLMARLLECFQSNKATMICSCYENALKRDPTCNHSLERLVKMHKTGNYSTIFMFEMIALHLDAANGKCSIWEEFASCFRKLLMATVSDYEDCTSVNLQRGFTNTISSSKIPRAFTEGNARGPWKLRFKWWMTRHFCCSSLSEQAGDRKLLCFKAACASHLYGPRFEYVITVLGCLRKEGDSDHISFLPTHMQNSMNLYEHL